MTQVLEIDGMREAAEAATALLRVLANEDRLLLLCQMTAGEKSVGELEALLDIRQPTLSQQLGVLRAEGLVTTRREGKRIYYAVADPKVLAVLNTLYGLYCAKREADARAPAKPLPYPFPRYRTNPRISLTAAMFSRAIVLARAAPSVRTPSI